jgi:hypothetical protein
MTLPPFVWQGHILVWQIHFLGGQGHFLPHDRFRAKVLKKTKINVLATLKNDLATQKNDLATFCVWQGHILVWQGHFEVWQGHFFGCVYLALATLFWATSSLVRSCRAAVRCDRVHDAQTSCKDTTRQVRKTKDQRDKDGTKQDETR